MFTRPLAALFAILFATLASLPLAARELRSGMVVCVVGGEGEPLADAAITLNGPLIQRTRRTGELGCAFFPALEAAEWDVTADLAGRSLRHRLGVRVPPGAIVRLTLELPMGDEIITDTDDRVLPDLAVSQHVVREGSVLVSRAGNSSLDAVLRELPTARPTWIGSFPRAGDDLRRFGPLPSTAAELRVDGVRVDGVLVGEADPDWIDPRAFATVHADDASGAPLIDMVPRTYSAPSGAVSIEWTDRALQSSSELARLSDFSRVLASAGTEMIPDRATAEVSWNRTRGDWYDAARDETRMSEGWHAQSRVSWGERQMTRILVAGGRRLSPDEDAERDQTSILALSHELMWEGWRLSAQTSSLRARRFGELRFEEEGDGFVVEIGRSFSGRVANHDVRIRTSAQRNIAGLDFETREVGISDYFVGRTFSALGVLRWSDREIGSASMGRVDPSLAIAWRPFLSPRRVIRAGAGRRSPDSIDVTDGDPDETFEWASLRWEEALGEWTIGEAGAARSEALDGALDGAEWTRGWLSVRRRYSSGYSVRGFARWLEVRGDDRLDGDAAWIAGSDWAVGGELLLDLPTGWSVAVTGDLREGLEPGAGDDDQVSNVDLRAGRLMHPVEQVALRVWGELRNAFDSAGVIGWSAADALPVARQPRTFVLGASVEF